MERIKIYSISKVTSTAANMNCVKNANQLIL